MDLATLSQALDALNELDPGALPLHHAAVLLFIGRKGSVTYKEVQDQFGLSNASASRILNSLSFGSPHRKHCLGLVAIGIDPAEGRRYRAKLTRKGAAVLRRLEQL